MTNKQLTERVRDLESEGRMKDRHIQYLQEKANKLDQLCALLDIILELDDRFEPKQELYD